ncbi:MAG: sugar transferase [Lachnospiraceae bacterium]|nr:sugar transferase [Lachnospiraceae bacterium]
MLLTSRKFRKALILITDIISIILSFSLSYIMRYGNINLYLSDYYYRTIFVIILIYFMVFFIHDTDKGLITDKGVFQNFITVGKNSVYMLIYVVIYFFITQEGILVSRYLIGMFFILFVLVDYLTRLLIRYYFKKLSGSNVNMVNIMLVTRMQEAAEILGKIKNSTGNLMHVSCITIVDEDRVGEEIDGVPIVGNMENYMNTRRDNVYDEVLISVPYKYKMELKKMVKLFEQMGVTVNLHIEIFDMDGREKVIRDLAGFHVISFRSRTVSTGELVLKRMFDILGGLVGTLIFIVAYVIIGPIIRLTSPGPALFTQERVGINGRIFKLYKFRSMYQDAEERKAALMEQNEMEGFMFKMQDDPRITPIGKFIRKTSIDEIPQFINVLLGDMSLVGTRPPTVDEYKKYKNYHMRRLSIKPGITGLWQVSGRSDITDFEQVVKLDLAYIDNWSILLDIRLIFRTIVVVFKKSGAR